MKKLVMPSAGSRDRIPGSAIERVKAIVGGHHKAIEEITKVVNANATDIDSLSQGLAAQKTLIEKLQDRVDFLELPWHKRIFRRGVGASISNHLSIGHVDKAGKTIRS